MAERYHMAERIAEQEMPERLRMEIACYLMPYRSLIIMAKERRFPFKNITLPDGKCVPIVDAILSCLRTVKENYLSTDEAAWKRIEARVERLEEIRIILEYDPYFEPDTTQ